MEKFPYLKYYIIAIPHSYRIVYRISFFFCGLITKCCVKLLWLSYTLYDFFLLFLSRAHTCFFGGLNIFCTFIFLVAIRDSATDYVNSQIFPNFPFFPLIFFGLRKKISSLSLLAFVFLLFRFVKIFFQLFLFFRFNSVPLFSPASREKSKIKKFYETIARTAAERAEYSERTELVEGKKQS